MEKLFIFIAGAALGSAVTYKLVKDKYTEVINKEIKEAKEVWYRKKEEATKGDNTKDMSVVEYAEKIDDLDYDTESDKEEADEDIIVTIIEPEEFGEMEEDGFACISLTYYKDGYLTDDKNQLVIDPVNEIGQEALDYLKNGDEDSVYVRNEKLMADYEILKTLESFEDISSEEE